MTSRPKQECVLTILFILYAGITSACLLNLSCFLGQVGGVLENWVLQKERWLSSPTQCQAERTNKRSSLRGGVFLVHE